MVVNSPLIRPYLLGGGSFGGGTLGSHDKMCFNLVGFFSFFQPFHLCCWPVMIAWGTFCFANSEQKQWMIDRAEFDDDSSKTPPNHIHKQFVSVCEIADSMTRWWFQVFFIFTPTWGDDPV